MTDHRDTVVVREGGGSGFGAILGILAIVIVLAVAWYILMGPGASAGNPNDINVNVAVPSLVPQAS